MRTLVVTDLAKSFTLHARGAVISALEGCSFEVAAGEVVALVGPSGAGKSTILKCIHRTYLPTCGSIRLTRGDGSVVDLATCDEHAVLASRATDLGFVTQFLHCLPRKSALDVVAEPLVQQRVPIAQARQRAGDLLARLGIPERLTHLAPATFSGGEKQRVNIARGFCRPNRLLLLDEPTASLDAATAERVVTLIEQARDAGTAIVAIWHDRSLVERLATRTVSVSAPAGAVVAA